MPLHKGMVVNNSDSQFFWSEDYSSDEQSREWSLELGGALQEHRYGCDWCSNHLGAG
jgi:hypothetical protein